MSATCPNGHPSEATDYCDLCGAPISTTAPASPSAPPSPLAPAPAGGAQPCPDCQVVNPTEALFCENCGYSFATGTPGRGADPATWSPTTPSPTTPSPTTPSPANSTPSAGWVVEVWVDPDWYAEQDSEEACPSSGLPVVLPLTGSSLLIGRVSRHRNIHPEIDCSADIGVSREQARLTTDGTRWWVEDLGSANGTYVGAAGAPLPIDPMPPGQRRELAEDDRVYVGAWTMLVVRRATDQERAG
jgi:FHA domain